MSYRADRHWRAYLVGALVVGAIGAALPVWSLNSPGTNSETSAASISLSGIFFFGLAFLLALGLALRGVRGWHRTRRRYQALGGDVNAMPESTIEPDATDVFDVSREPLVLVWRMEHSSSASLPSSAEAIFVGLAGVLTFWLLFIGATLVLYRWFPTFASSALARYWTRQTFLIALAVLFSVLVVLGSISRRVISLVLHDQLERDRLTIVEATSAGIRFQPIIGNVRLMRWEDMRLLEVEEQRRKRWENTFVTRFYALYDRHQFIISWVEWGSKEVSVPQPEGISWDDMWALSRELVDVIYQRTGLVPRTFSKSLQRGPADALEETRWEVEEAEEV